MRTLHDFQQYVNPTLGRVLSQLAMDKTFERGEGCYLYDKDANRYLDFLAQYGALPFGFNHPRIWEAIEQVRDSFEPSFVQPSCLAAAGQLAKRLIEVAPGMRYVALANSGAEAVEAAIKLARSRTGRRGILAASNGFHGKTLGALSATDKKKYQEVFGAPVPGFAYVPFGDREALAGALASQSYAAFIVEPIQGEGGIVEAPAGYLSYVQEVCQATGTLFILDEIQTGLGRTGAMFAYEDELLSPDIVTVAKALSGGLIPIGACLYREEVFNDDFAMKHTSTFAGNSLACRVGIATLDLLEENDRFLIREVAQNGARMKEALLNLQRQYPEIVGEVRGRGYMLGIRFGINRYNWGADLLGCIGETEVLSSLVVSHMLNFEGVRLGFTLNQGGVLRIEPPLIATWQECQLFIEAFERTLIKIAERNTAHFTAHLTGFEINGAKARTYHRAPATRFPVVADDGRFAFLLHPLTVRNYVDMDSSLGLLSDGQMTKLAACVADNFDPFVIGDAQIISDTGRKAYGEFIIVPRTAEELVRMPYQDSLAEIRAAAKVAQARGAKLIGLGAYTSIVTRSGLYLKNGELPALTTGNSYTVIAGKQSISSVLNQRDVNLSDTCVAVLGAAGSIGRAMSLLLAKDVGRLLLIGNPAHPAESRNRLLQVAGEILRSLWELRLQGAEFSFNSLAETIFTAVSPRHSHTMTTNDWAQLAEEVEDKLGVLRATSDKQLWLPDADVLVTATSAVNELLTPDDLKERAIICDISRPSNVSQAIKAERPDVLVLDGGVVRLPANSQLGFNIDLGEGLVYACMAETMMLALEHHYEDTSLGFELDLRRIAEMERLAALHGFKVAVDQSGVKELVHSACVSEMSAASGCPFHLG